MTKNEMLFFKKIRRLEKNIKALREQLRIATNILRADSKHDNSFCVENMKTCLENTKDYFRGETLTEEDCKMFIEFELQRETIDKISSDFH